MYRRVISAPTGARDALVIGRKMAEFEDAAIRVAVAGSSPRANCTASPTRSPQHPPRR
jgi:hypothetical protein